MRHFLVFSLLVTLAACATPERPDAIPSADQEAEMDTDNCLDNPELARSWGDCNVKQTVFTEGKAFARCRKLAPKAKSGALNFQLQVKADGHVRSAKASPKSKFPKLEACIAKVMKGLKFARPPEGREPVITVPYQLAP